MEITEQSKKLFTSFANDSVNWGGVPLLDFMTKEQRGNLTQLKKAGLVTTEYDSFERLKWLSFTEDGERYANELDINLGADHLYKINAAHFPCDCDTTNAPHTCQI